MRFHLWSFIVGALSLWLLQRFVLRNRSAA